MNSFQKKKLEVNNFKEFNKKKNNFCCWKAD